MQPARAGFGAVQCNRRLHGIAQGMPIPSDNNNYLHAYHCSALYYRRLIAFEDACLPLERAFASFRRRALTLAWHTWNRFTVKSRNIEDDACHELRMLRGRFRQWQRWAAMQRFFAQAVLNVLIRASLRPKFFLWHRLTIGSIKAHRVLQMLQFHQHRVKRVVFRCWRTAARRWRAARHALLARALTVSHAHFLQPQIS